MKNTSHPKMGVLAVDIESQFVHQTGMYSSSAPQTLTIHCKSSS